MIDACTHCAHCKWSEDRLCLLRPDDLIESAIQVCHRAGWRDLNELHRQPHFFSFPTGVIAEMMERKEQGWPRD